MDAYSIFPLDPSKIAWTSKIKTKWDVTKYTSASQGRRTLTHQEYPTWQFDISFPALTTQEVDTLLAFHMFCKGSWNPFFYKDYERHNANVTLKDGETYYYKANGLPLIIPLSVGGYTFGEPCYMADFVRVYRDGVEDTENFTVTADDSGQLRVYLTDVETDEGTLQTTVITATYEYYYRVAFQDSITINERFRNNYSVSLSLETVKQTVTSVGDNDIWTGDETYNVTITQSEHQAISVKKIKNGSTIATYVQSFSVIGNYTIEINIEAYGGYVPGRLYVDGVEVESGTRLDVDHDVNIVATAAESGATVFANGSIGHLVGTDQQNTQYLKFYSTAACTSEVYKTDLSGKLIVKWVEGGPLYTNGNQIFGSGWMSLIGYCKNVTSIEQDIDMSNVVWLTKAFMNCQVLKSVNVENWNVANVIHFEGMGQNCSTIDKFNCSNWNTVSATNMSNMFDGWSRMESYDLSQWSTANVTTVNSMFKNNSRMKVLDISNWNTESIADAENMLSGCSSLQYIIMNSQDVKFSGSVAMPSPNSTCKYLVPANMVATYQAHANWSARASRIDSIDNYTITRNNGQITVTENAS